MRIISLAALMFVLAACNLASSQARPKATAASAGQSIPPTNPSANSASPSIGPILTPADASI